MKYDFSALNDQARDNAINSALGNGMGCLLKIRMTMEHLLELEVSLNEAEAALRRIVSQSSLGWND